MRTICSKKFEKINLYMFLYTIIPYTYESNTIIQYTMNTLLIPTHFCTNTKLMSTRIIMLQWNLINIFATNYSYVDHSPVFGKHFTQRYTFVFFLFFFFQNTRFRFKNVIKISQRKTFFFLSSVLFYNFFN